MNVQAAFETMYKEATRPRRTRLKRPKPTVRELLKPKPRVDPPLRLQELQTNLDAYKKELQAIVDDSLPNTADSLICNALKTQADDMLTKLHDLPKNKAIGSLFKPGGADPIPTEEVLASLKRCTEPLPERPAPPEEQTWDLLAKVTQPTRPFVCTGLELENRVSHLEGKCVGDHLAQKVNFPDLISAVQFTAKRLDSVYRSVKSRGRVTRFDKFRQELAKLEEDLLPKNSSRYWSASTYTRTQDFLLGLEPKEDPDEKKIDELLSIFTKGAPRMEGLRRVATRFETLAGVHTCLARFIGDVNSAVDEHAKLLEEVQQYREVLRRSIESFQTNERMMRENWEAVEKRVQALDC